MKELFGQRLREQRIKHGLTLEQLAEKSELSSNYIGMVERGLKGSTRLAGHLYRQSPLPHKRGINHKLCKRIG